MTGAEQIRIGINNILDTHFPNVDIYGEEVKQGFEEPCFFVQIISSSLNREIDIRYDKRISFDIHYFAKTNAELRRVEELLYEYMEYISVGNLLYRARNMNTETVDGVLHCFLDFDFKVIKEKEKQIPMRQLQMGVTDKDET